MFDRETNDTKAASRWEPYGTPLLSSIQYGDLITRGDVQKAIQKMLSPFLKAEGSRHADITYSNTSPVASDACHDQNSEGPCSNHASKSKVSVQKLPLQLIDESNAFIDLSVGEEKAIKLLGSAITLVVYLDWSQ